MVTKKQDTKAPKAAVKKAVKKVDYRSMSAADLHKLLAEKHQDLLDSRRSLMGGELVNPRVLGVTRKDIARIKTAIRTVDAADKESK